MYRVSSDLVAFLIFLILFVYYMNFYNLRENENRYFGRMLICGLVSSFFRGLFIATMNGRFITASVDFKIIADTISIVFVIFYYWSASFYIYRRGGYRGVRYILFDAIVGTLGTGIVIANVWTHWLFEITAEGSVRGEYYYFLFITPALLGAHASYKWLRFRIKRVERSLFLAILSAIIPITASLVEILNSNSKASLVTISAALLSILIYNDFDAYDYERIESAMTLLEESRIREAIARQEAEKASKAKTNFLANMTHEIRTPINAIMGLNEIILREAESESIKDYAVKIQEANTTLLSTVNDVLDFSKLESGKMKIISDKYDIADVLVSELSIYMPKAKDKGVDFKVAVDNSLPKKLFGDEVLLRRVLSNLLDNAVKYTETGSVEFSVDIKGTKNYPDKQVAVISFTVKDTGCGMESVEKMIDAFERDDAIRNKNIEGSGLGLKITEEILKLMNSELRIDSALGKGTTVTFVIEQQIMSVKKVSDFEKLLNKGEELTKYKPRIVAPDAKILAVDDTKINLFVMKKLLLDTQIQVYTAASGKEAIEMVKKERFDIIFMDHLMPEMNGIEAAKIIKSMPEASDIPIIAFTASVSSDKIEAFDAAGFAGFLSKPIEFTKLEATIERLLSKKKDGVV